MSLLGLPATGGFLENSLLPGCARAARSALRLARGDCRDHSVIGAYYYLRVIIVMYFSEPTKDYTPASVAPALGFALAIAAIGTIYLGILPGPSPGPGQTAADSLAIR